MLKYEICQPAFFTFLRACSRRPETLGRNERICDIVCVGAAAGRLARRRTDQDGAEGGGGGGVKSRAMTWTRSTPAVRGGLHPILRSTRSSMGATGLPNMESSPNTPCESLQTRESSEEKVMMPNGQKHLSKSPSGNPVTGNVTR